QMGPHVRVNAIAPGGVLRAQPDMFRERYEARTPLGRMAVEEDLKGAVAYLARDLSSYVTGHTLVVDGGLTAWSRHCGLGAGKAAMPSAPSSSLRQARARTATSTCRGG